MSILEDDEIWDSISVRYSYDDGLEYSLDTYYPSAHQERAIREDLEELGVDVDFLLEE